MPPEPVPEDPGWDDGPAWPDRDPMSAADREAWLDHLAAADDMLAAEAAMTRAARPGHGRIRSDLPGESSVPGGLVRAGDGAGRRCGRRGR